LRLRFVKTKFHTGRLVLAYQDDPDLAAVGSIQDSQWVHREIIDIADVTDIDIVLPYVGQKSWNSCGTLGLTSGALTPAEPSGTFSLIVVNELVAPSTVTPNIEVIAEVFAGDDFEFAVPRVSSGIVPFTDTVIYAEPQVAQSSVTSTMRNRSASCVIKKVSLGTSFFCGDIKVYTQSEFTRSLRDFLLCASAGYCGTQAGTSLSVRPFTIGATSRLGLANNQGYFAGDYYGAIAPMFAMSRGGVGLYTTSTNSFSTWAYLDYEHNALLAFDPTATTQSACLSFSRPVIIDNNRSTLVTVPFSQDTFARFNRVCDANATGGTAEPILTCTPLTSIRYKNSAAPTGLRFFRSCTDDVQMLFFIGCPPFTVASGLSLPSEEGNLPQAAPSMVLASAVSASSPFAPQAAVRSLPTPPVTKKTTVVPV